MKNKKGLVLVLGLLIVTMLACGMQPASVPATVQPTYTFYPTQVVPPTRVPPTQAPSVGLSVSRLTEIVLDNGFTRFSESDCSDGSCKAYMHPEALIVQIYNDSSFSLGALLLADSDSSVQGQVIGAVIGEACGSSVLSWIGENWPSFEDPSHIGFIDGWAVKTAVLYMDSGTPLLLLMFIPD